MNRVRTFVAIPCGDAIRQAAKEIMHRLGAADAKVRWVRPENLHWTLKFLGNVELRQTAEICRVVQEVARQSPPFEMHVATVGAFPHAQRPRTVWLGVDQGSAAFTQLAGLVERRLSQRGYKEEHRPVVPHLTLGRVRGSMNIAALAQRIAAEAETSLGIDPVQQIVVYNSELQSGGPVYQPLCTADLDG